MSDKLYFCFLLEWADMFKLLTEEQSGRLIKAMIAYEMQEVEPDFSDDGILNFAWQSNVKNKMDSLKAHFRETSEKRSKAGKASAEQRKKQNESVEQEETQVNTVQQNQQMLTNVKSVQQNQQMSHIDLDIDIDLDKKEKINKKEKEPRHKYGEYENVLLSDSELNKLQTEFPTDWQNRIENVSSYCKSHGKTYKDYLATIRNWARKDSIKPVYNPHARNDVQAGYEQAMRLLGSEEYG